MSRGASRKILGEGKHLRLVNRDGWDFAERVGAVGAVAIVAVTDDHRLLLTEQYRVPVGRHVIELPAGIVGDQPGQESEALAAAAKRELLEETGYEAGVLVYLTQGPPSAGLGSELVTLFAAVGLRKVHAGGGQGGESIRVHEVPLAGAAQWLAQRAAQGVLIDPKVYAGLFFVADRALDKGRT